MHKTREEYNEYMCNYMREQYNARVRRATVILGGKCAVCGGVVNLEIDHIDWCSKLMTVTRMCRASEERFLAELAKCQLLCKPHHIQKSKADHLEIIAIRGWANQYGRASLVSLTGKSRWLLPIEIPVRIRGGVRDSNMVV